MDGWGGINDFNAQDVACGVWAMATVLIPGTPSPALSSRGSSACAHDLNPQNLTNTVWTSRKPAAADSSTTDGAFPFPTSRVRSYRSLGVANSEWDLATVRLRGLRTLRAAQSEKSDGGPWFSPAEMTNIAWGSGTAKHEEATLFSVLQLATEMESNGHTPHELAIIG